MHGALRKRNECTVKGCEVEITKSCGQCAEEHIQLAEWLKELKRLREKHAPKIPNVEGDGYVDGKMVYDTWICPGCGTEYEIDYDRYEFCPKCGQAIDRSEMD